MLFDVSIREDELGGVGDDVIASVGLVLDTSANNRSRLRLVDSACIAGVVQIISAVRTKASATSRMYIPLPIKT